MVVTRVTGLRCPTHVWEFSPGLTHLRMLNLFRIIRKPCSKLRVIAPIGTPLLITSTTRLRVKMASQNEPRSSEFATKASTSQKKPRNKARSGEGSGGTHVKLRGLPHDSEEVRYSKTLSWLLRHAAKSEGLPMRPDGFVRVSDLVRRLSLADRTSVLTLLVFQLKHNKLQNLDFPTLEQLVKDNAKQRFMLACEPEGANNVNDIWWIKATQGHSMKVCSMPDELPVRHSLSAFRK
jgi:hypothetical protein